MRGASRTCRDGEVAERRVWRCAPRRSATGRVSGRVPNGTDAHQRVRRTAQLIEMTRGQYPHVPHKIAQHRADNPSVPDHGPGPAAWRSDGGLQLRASRGPAPGSLRPPVASSLSINVLPRITNRTTRLISSFPCARPWGSPWGAKEPCKQKTAAGNIRPAERFVQDAPEYHGHPTSRALQSLPLK